MASEIKFAASRFKRDELLKVVPFSRHAELRHPEYLAPLREELLGSPLSEIAHVKLKIRKVMGLSAAFEGSDSLDNLSKRLSEKFEAFHVLRLWLNVMIVTSRFDDAQGLAQKIAADYPKNLPSQVQYADVIMLSGDAARAADHYRLCFDLAISDSGNDEYTGDIADRIVEAGEADWIRQKYPEFASQHQRVAALDRLAAPDPDLKIFCLNLEKDHLRLKATRHMMQGAGEFHRVNGIYGPDLPERLKDVLVRQEDHPVSSGAVGCALTHLAAWEAVARECEDDEYALIIEDDSRFKYGQGRGSKEVLEAARKANAGLVFVNPSACENVDTWAENSDIGVFPVDDVYGPQDTKLRPARSGWGCYGYYMTGVAAKQIADRYMQIGMLGDVDAQLFLMSFAGLGNWAKRRANKYTFDRLIQLGSWPKIDSYVTNFPIIVHRDYGYSAINSGSLQKAAN